MYYYIVDPQKISQAEFERVQNLLYSSVSEYRVAGEVVRATGLRTISQLVETAFSHGAKTIVAVGSDDTLQEVINAVGSRDMVLGFIPIFDSEIGAILGIKNVDQAAKTIASRRIAELDLGSVNGNLFFSKLTFGISQQKNLTWIKAFNIKSIQSLFHLPEFEIKFSADNQFSGSLKVIGGMISNNNPINGKLDVMLLTKLSKVDTFTYRKEILAGEFQKIPGSSVIHVKKLEISYPEGLPLKSGSRIIAKTPAAIQIKPKALKIIVGKDRQF